MSVNPFINIQISIRGEVVTVQYGIDPAFQGRMPYSFELIAYLDENFKEPLYSIPSTTFYAIDDTRTRQNMLPSYMYRLKLTDANNLQYLSNFIGWHPSDSIIQHHYLIAADISRREHVRFNYAGLFAYILKRKEYTVAQVGEVDPVTNEPLIDDTVAYGVGADKGYYDPVLARLSIEKRETKQILDDQGRGTQFSEMLYCRCAGFPFIDQHDIIVTPDAKRYTVIDPANKYFPGTTLILLQTPTLRLIPPTDTVYNITIPVFPSNEL
jgi:hypothetical protein